MTVERIELNDPVTPNEIGLECECVGECGKLFTYLEVYTKCIDWIDAHAKSGYDYHIIRTDCTYPRVGDIVAYIDYHGAILCGIYAKEEE